jgi:hypothetical protein
MLVNFLCAPLVWFLYPETAGRALEDMDAIFGTAAAASVDDGRRRREDGGGVLLRGEDQGDDTPRGRMSREEEERLLG